jgi:hypothetical protein
MSPLRAQSRAHQRKPSTAPESHYNQAPVHEPPSALAASHAKGGTRSETICRNFSACAKRSVTVDTRKFRPNPVPRNRRYSCRSEGLKILPPTLRSKSGHTGAFRLRAW